MECAVSTEVLAENHRRAAQALAEKNKQMRLQAALRGEAGAWEGLKATWGTGSADYLFSLHPAWFIGSGLLLMGLIGILRRK